MKQYKSNPMKFLRWYVRFAVLLMLVFLFGLGLFLWEAYQAVQDSDWTFGSVVLIVAMVFASLFCWKQVKSLATIIMEIVDNKDAYAQSLQKLQESRDTEKSDV